MRTTPWSRDRHSASRRAATAAVSTARPMPGRSGTTRQPPIGGAPEAPARAAGPPPPGGKLGETFGLDRCSIFLAERGGKSVRLVASYEDPTIRNYVVDLERYPELKRAMQTGETVFIPDAANDPSLKHVKGELISRRVKSITVVPITWRSAAIGAIFLRTFRDGPTFSDEDVGFVQVVASLTAQALRNAHRYERLAQRHRDTDEAMRRMELERVALLAFLRRLLGAFGEREGPWAEGLLSRASTAELDRLVGVALAVIQEEAKGR